MAQKIKCKELLNTELANGYGGWIYCNGCRKTIGYLCYVTYNSFKLEYNCKCGNSGSIMIELEASEDAGLSNEHLTTIKNRLCCPEDHSPLITILSKKLNSYSYEIVCKACGKKYKGEGEIE